MPCHYCPSSEQKVAVKTCLVCGASMCRTPAGTPGKDGFPEPPTGERCGGRVSLEMPGAPGDEPDLLSIMCSVCLYCVFPGRVSQGARVHQYARQNRSSG